MKVLGRPAHRVRARSGAALLLALLLLVILIAITIQIGVTTGTDARVARNDLALSNMELAIESALLEVEESLKLDAESGAGGEAAAADPTGGAAPAATPATPATPGAPGAQDESNDSRKDEWASPQRTQINEIDLRIFVQDEDSKYNVLNLLNPVEAEAEAAFERVVRILDLFREGDREADVDRRTAEEMARVMRDHMRRRHESVVPQPSLLTDRDEDEGGMPLTIEEFAAIEPFAETHFIDYRNADGVVVHSLASFLTVWSSPGLAGDLPVSEASAGARQGAAGAAGGAQGTSGAAGQGGAAGSSSAQGRSSSGGTSSGAGGSTRGASGQGASSQGAAGQGAGAQGAGGPAAAGSGSAAGGYAVNLNTAPAAVLKALFDDRELHPRFFDALIEYRNLEEEEDPEATVTEEEEEARFDEYGQEILERRAFESLAELAEVEGYTDLPPDVQQKLNQLLTPKSNVFSIYVVARRSTAVQAQDELTLTPAEQRKREETGGDSLVRVVRSVVWRRDVDGEVQLVPLVRWQVLDYLPYEVLDFPPEDR
jgi:hypothetical protein